MKTYELTVYHTVNNRGYSILQKSFTNITEMIVYCTDFDNSEGDLLFDVWYGGKQFNLNEEVRAWKEDLREEDAGCLCSLCDYFYADCGDREGVNVYCHCDSDATSIPLCRLINR